MAGKKKTVLPAEWKPGPRIRAFLAAYRATCSITRAAAAAGISRRAHYRKLETSADYKVAFEAATAMAADSLEDEAVRRAKEGIVRQVLYHGSPAMELVDPLDPEKGMKARLEREYSDQLLLALLKAKKPKEYRDRLEHDVAPGLAKKFDGTMEEALSLYRALVTKPKGDDDK
jgi:hypothetical protein